MRIVYFTESLPPKTDGVTHTFSKLVETLEHRSIDYRFYSPVMPGESIAWRNRVHQVKSVPIPLYDYYRIGIPTADVLRAELDDFQPDLIHCTTPTPLGILGARYARTNGIPAVSSYHTHFVSYFRYYGYQLFENFGWSILRWFHNKFAATYVPTSNVASELEERGFQNLQLWQRGIELERFMPELRNEDLRSSVGIKDEPILLFVGRLVKEKDLDDLVAADMILKNKGHKFKIVIIGDGPMREELEQKLPNAHLTGFVHGAELASWYASSDILAFPSTTETFGNVIQEAHASGLPTVCVDKGGVVDLIRDGVNGYIAKANKPEDFATKLEPLIKSRNLRARMGQQARILVAENTWEKINGRLLNSYNQIAGSFMNSFDVN